METILHFLQVASPYICGAWCIIYAILDSFNKKALIKERANIRQVLKDNYNIDYDDVIADVRNLNQ